MSAQSTASSQRSFHKGLSPSLKAANADGMAWAAMVGLGENYLNIFGIFLKATSLQLALLATLPQFLGALFQLVGVWAMKFSRSRRTSIVKVVWINAIVWVPIACLPFLGLPNQSLVWLLICFVVLYHASGSFTSPAWSSLIGDLVPAHIRGTYFGYRNRLISLCTLLGVLAAGQILDFAKGASHTAIGFFCIFLLAAISRVVSILYLKKYDDPAYEVKHEHHFSLWQFLRRSPKSNFARFVYYTSWINFAVNISAPFFALFMLQALHFSYLELTIVTATNTVTQFLTMQYWGRLSDQFGNKKIMNICGYGLALSPILWIFGTDFWYLLGIQMYAGFVWSGFNLAAANFMYDAVTPPKRARCVAYQAVVNGAFVLVGSILGGTMADHLPTSLNLMGYLWAPLSALYFVFLTSGLVRLAASFLLLPLFSEVRPVEHIRHSELIFRITNIASITDTTFSVFTGVRRKKSRSRAVTSPEKSDLPG